MQYPVSRKKAKKTLGYLAHHYHRLAKYANYHPEDSSAGIKAKRIKDAMVIVEEYIKHCPARESD